MFSRKTLIGLLAAFLLLAAACSGDDRPSFDESVDGSSDDTGSSDSGDDTGDSADSGDADDSGDSEAAADATPEPTGEPLVKLDPPPAPDGAAPPQPTAEDAIAYYSLVALDAPFVGDCANKPDGDPSQTLCYVTDNITWSVGLNETDFWYLMVVSQVEGGWVVTEVNLWGPPVAGDPATEEGA